MRPFDSDRYTPLSEQRRTASAAAHLSAPLAPAGLLRADSQLQFPPSLPFSGLLINKLLTSLPGEDFARLLPHLEPVTLYAGQPVYKFGAPVDCAYFPETAVLSHVFLLEDGSSTAATMVGNEGIVGLSAVLESHPRQYLIQVTIPGNAMQVNLDVIREEFRSNGAMQRLLLGYIGRRLAQLSQRALCNSRHSLGERLCTWLLMVRDRTPVERLPLTHEEIASHLGARRAGVTSACTALRDAGIIQYRRGLISIVDRPRLEMVACECYRASTH